MEQQIIEFIGTWQGQVVASALVMALVMAIGLSFDTSYKPVSSNLKKGS